MPSNLPDHPPAPSNPVARSSLGPIALPLTHSPHLSMASTRCASSPDVTAMRAALVPLNAPIVPVPFSGPVSSKGLSGSARLPPCPWGDPLGLPSFPGEGRPWRDLDSGGSGDSGCCVAWMERTSDRGLPPRRRGALGSCDRGRGSQVGKGGAAKRQGRLPAQAMRTLKAAETQDLLSDAVYTALHSLGKAFESNAYVHPGPCRPLEATSASSVPHTSE